MPIRIVQSKQNARLKQLRRALEHPPRLAAEPEAVVALEGPKLLEEALRAGLTIECVFAAHEAEWQLEALHLPAHVELLLMEHELLAPVLSTETPQPIAALVHPRQSRDFLQPTGSGLILVLAGLQDPGNLGTLARSAEAFGARGILCLPGTVTPWNPKAIRASAGSLFRMAMLALPTDEAFAALHDSGYKVWTTAVNEAQHPVAAQDAPLSGPVAVVIGNEGKGVPDEVAALCDGALTIPCPGPVESLNASTAASILLYEAARQRISKAGGR